LNEKVARVFKPIMLQSDAKSITFRRLNENRSIVSVSVIVCVHNDIFL